MIPEQQKRTDGKPVAIDIMDARWAKIRPGVERRPVQDVKTPDAPVGQKPDSASTAPAAAPTPEQTPALALKPVPATPQPLNQVEPQKPAAPAVAASLLSGIFLSATTYVDPRTEKDMTPADVFHAAEQQHVHDIASDPCLIDNGFAALCASATRAQAGKPVNEREISEQLQSKKNEESLSDLINTYLLSQITRADEEIDSLNENLRLVQEQNDILWERMDELDEEIDSAISDFIEANDEFNRQIKETGSAEDDYTAARKAEEDARTALNEKDSAASRDQNGTMVFVNSAGAIVSQDGTVLDESTLAARGISTDQLTSWEERKEVADKFDVAAQNRKEAQAKLDQIAAESAATLQRKADAERRLEAAELEQEEIEEKLAVVEDASEKLAAHRSDAEEYKRRVEEAKKNPESTPEKQAAKVNELSKQAPLCVRQKDAADCRWTGKIDLNLNRRNAASRQPSAAETPPPAPPPADPEQTASAPQPVAGHSRVPTTSAAGPVPDSPIEKASGKLTQSFTAVVAPDAAPTPAADPAATPDADPSMNIAAAGQQRRPSAVGMNL